MNFEKLNKYAKLYAYAANNAINVSDLLHYNYPRRNLEFNPMYNALQEHTFTLDDLKGVDFRSPDIDNIVIMKIINDVHDDSLYEKILKSRGAYYSMARNATDPRFLHILSSVILGNGLNLIALNANTSHETLEKIYNNSAYRSDLIKDLLKNPNTPKHIKEKIESKLFDQKMPIGWENRPVEINQ